MDIVHCTACDSISGVYYDICDDCMTSYNKLREENREMLAMLNRLDEMLAGFNLDDQEQVVYGELAALIAKAEGGR